jgi:hypothetical protein
MNTQLIESLVETIRALTPAEHQELLNLTDAIEQFDADRLQHLLELAQLRQISLPELLDRLNISTPPVYA